MFYAQSSYSSIAFPFHCVCVCSWLFCQFHSNVNRILISHFWQKNNQLKHFIHNNKHKVNTWCVHLRPNGLPHLCATRKWYHGYCWKMRQMYIWSVEINDTFGRLNKKNQMERLSERLEVSRNWAKKKPASSKDELYIPDTMVWMCVLCPCKLYRSKWYVYVYINEVKWRFSEYETQCWKRVSSLIHSTLCERVLRVVLMVRYNVMASNPLQNKNRNTRCIKKNHHKSRSTLLT